MIKILSIERFKSIRRLQMNCRRVNLFIGEPNVGKSNILEALGLLSWCADTKSALKDFVRLTTITDLFYDGLTSEGPIRIEAQGGREQPLLLLVAYERDQALFRTASDKPQFVQMDANANRLSGKRQEQFENIRFYRFKELDSFPGSDAALLAPPSGENMFSVVFGSKRLRERVTDIFRTGGLSLVMKPQEKTFELQKTVDGVVTAYRYPLTSDTLRRIAFFTVAMESNKDATLVFEEPEAHAFPYYTKQMGEEIAMDEANQYFIATHNPYLLTAIIEKVKKEDVHVFVTYFKGFETRVRPLSDGELGEALTGDPFFMSQRFVEDSVS